VTEAEWGLIEAYFQPTDKRGATPRHDKRDIVNAIFYLNKAGCHWRLLPKDFPPWQTVYDHWRRWNQRGVWEGALDALNEAHRKKTAGGRPTPSYGIVDSQSVKTAYASEGRGYDGNKKTKGRKRHVVVDTLGNLIQVLVHAALVPFG
jgi:putative transposase